MRLIPGKTKVKIELFRGVTIGDIIVGTIALALMTLVLLSTFPGRFYIILGIFSLCVLLLLRVDSQPNYVLLLGILRYLSYPRYYRRKVKDKELRKAAVTDEPDDDSNDNIRPVIAQIMREREKEQ